MDTSPKARRRCAERPAGFAELDELVRDLRAGKVTPATDRLAAVLARVLDGSLAPKDLDAALGLRRGRGRPAGDTTFGKLRIRTGGDLRGRTIAELHDKLDPACRFIWEHIEADPRPRGARARALKAAHAKFRIDKRALEKRWARARPVLELFKTARAIEVRMAAVLAPVRRLAATLAPLTQVLARARTAAMK